MRGLQGGTVSTPRLMDVPPGEQHVTECISLTGAAIDTSPVIRLPRLLTVYSLYLNRLLRVLSMKKDVNKLIKSRNE